MTWRVAAALLCVALGGCTRSDSNGDSGAPDTMRVMEGGIREPSPYTKPDSTTGEVDVQRSSAGGTNSPARPGGKAEATSGAPARDTTKKP